MHWVMSDIHGCLAEYRELRGKLPLTDSDTLYVLGDAIDRGPGSISVLRDVLSRKGTVYIPGNHDYFLRQLAPAYGFRETHGSPRPTLFERALLAGWLLDGGRSTLEEFRALTLEERQDILHRLNSAPAWLEVEAGGRVYVLVHKAVPGFPERPRFADWQLRHYLRPPAPFDRPFFPDGRIVVSGHTFTGEIRGDGRAEVYRSSGHIAVDCGCVSGGQLAACCLETGETVYVPARTCSRR